MVVIEEASEESRCGDGCDKNPSRGDALIDLRHYLQILIASLPAIKVEILQTLVEKQKKITWDVTCYPLLPVTTFNLLTQFSPQRYATVSGIACRLFPDGGPKLLLFNSPPDSDEHHDQDNQDALNDRTRSASIRGSCEASTIKNSKVKSSLKRKRGKAEKIISLQDLEPLFFGSLVEAANSLGVSRSTLKRKCRQFGISQWPSRKGNKRSCPTSTNKPEIALRRPQDADQNIISSNQEIGNVYKSIHQNTLMEHRPVRVLPYKCPKKGESNYSKTRRTTVDQNLNSVPRNKKMGGGKFSQCDNFGSTQFEDAFNSHLRQRVMTSTVKVTYKEDMIRFHMSLKSNINVLKKEVSRRLNLDLGTFKIKYWDDEDEWALLGCDSDWEECLWISRSSNRNAIRLLVQDNLMY